MAYYSFVSTDGNNIICMDAETSVSITRENNVSRSSVMTGAVVTDGYEIGSRTINISGVVTYSKSLSQKVNGNPTPIEFQRLVEQVIQSKQRFTLVSNKRGEVLFDDIDDCVILNYTINSKNLNAVDATLTIQEQYVTDAARETIIPPQLAENVKKGMSDQKDQGKGTSTQLKEEEVKEYTLFAKTFRGIGVGDGE